jgi:transcriptional regulator with PAS, ATPase and Fis domain
VRIPPLRERSREDLVALIGGLMDELAPQLPAAPRVLAEVALDALLRHGWPGNLREMRNVLERALLLARGRDVLDLAALPAELRGRSGTPDASTGDLRSLEEVERDHIVQALRAVRGNRTHAARVLGISRATLIKKIRDFGLANQPLGTSAP